jgi:hypothetical protein
MWRIVWELPVASTAFLEGITFAKLLGRSCSLETSMEGAGTEMKQLLFFFEEVEAFKCTYYEARSPAMSDAYDRIIEYENSAWLTEIKAQLSRNVRVVTSNLKHYMINFDDGPCYEFVCRKIEVQIDGEVVYRDPSWSASK